MRSKRKSAIANTRKVAKTETEDETETETVEAVATSKYTANENAVKKRSHTVL